jgi:hypothetical protein
MEGSFLDQFPPVAERWRGKVSYLTRTDLLFLQPRNRNSDCREQSVVKQGYDRDGANHPGNSGERAPRNWRTTPEFQHRSKSSLSSASAR